MGYLQDAVIGKNNKGKGEVILEKFDLLSDEILLKIFKYFSTIKEILILSKVNKRWRDIANELLSEFFLPYSFPFLYFSEDENDPFYKYQYLFTHSKDKKLIIFDKVKLEETTITEKIEILIYISKYQNSILFSLPNKLVDVIEDGNQPIQVSKDRKGIVIPIWKKIGNNEYTINSSMTIPVKKEENRFFKEIKERDKEFSWRTDVLEAVCHNESNKFICAPSVFCLCGSIIIGIVTVIAGFITLMINISTLPSGVPPNNPAMHSITYYLTTEASEEYDYYMQIENNIFSYGFAIAFSLCLMGCISPPVLCIIRLLLGKVADEKEYDKSFKEKFSFRKFTPAMVENGESSSGNINVEEEEMQPLRSGKKKT